MYRKLAMIPLLSFVVSTSLTLLENNGADSGSLADRAVEAARPPLTTAGEPSSVSEAQTR